MIDNFFNWLQKQDEASAFTRLRRDAALGLKPSIPDAQINSRSTGSPFEQKSIKKKNKKSKKKK